MGLSLMGTFMQAFVWPRLLYPLLSISHFLIKITNNRASFHPKWWMTHLEQSTRTRHSVKQTIVDVCLSLNGHGSLVFPQQNRCTVTTRGLQYKILQVHMNPICGPFWRANVWTVTICTMEGKPCHPDSKKWATNNIHYRLRKNEKTTCCISGPLQSPLTRKKHGDDHISSFDRCVGGDDELGVGSSFVMPLVASLWAKNCQEKTWKNIFPHKSQHFFEKVILPADTIPFHAWNHAGILSFL